MTPSADSHPILGPVRQVAEEASHVRVDSAEIQRIARWLAAEELPFPDFHTPWIPKGDDSVTMDFIFLTTCVNFAFTDFQTGEVFKVERDGVWRSDSDAMMTCLKEAYEAGVPVLEGKWLATARRRDLEEIFTGSIPIPLLEERLRIFREVGTALREGFGGRFHRFVQAGPSRLYASAQGLLERLLQRFPSFNDVSLWRGLRVPFQKRAQLLFWLLHARLRKGGFFRLEDPEKLTIFADYIVPMALREMGILVYSAELEETVESRRIVPADSEQEIEIRAASIWACHLLTEAINRLRPAERRVIDAVVDARLWTHYHASHRPHHLTVTTDY